MASTPLDQLQEFLYGLFPLDAAAWSDLCAYWKPVEARRKEILTRAGTVEKYLYFVSEGVQRAVFEHERGEATLVFTYPPSFSGVVDSFLLQIPSRYHLECLTASKLLRIHHTDFVQVMARHRSLETFVREALTRQLAGAMERQMELLAFSAEEKFTTLLRRSPQVLQLIPHKYLASYIGVDPATFSKLMGTVRL